MLKEKGQLIEISEEEKFEEETKQLLGELLGTEICKTELMNKGVTWLGRPPGGRMLDVGFVPKTEEELESEELELARVDVLARDSTVGIIVRPDYVPYVEVERLVRADKELGPLLNRGAKVVIATHDDLRHWTRFYQQVADSELYKTMGRKLLDYSGLGRTDEAFADRFEAATNQLLRQQQSKFVELGVTPELPARGKFDRAFMDAKGKVRGVPLCHVRVAELENEILVETVLSEMVLTPGFVVRRSGESKREAYERARNLANYWRRDSEWKGQFTQMRVEVPVVSSGQLSIWHKLGMWSELDSYLPATGLKVEDVLRFLYFGRSNIEPGELAIEGLSLPEPGNEFKGVDIVFKRKVSADGKYQFVGVDNLAGLNPKVWPKWQKEIFENEGDYMSEKFETIQTTNIGGIVIFPDETSKEEMKERVERLEYDLAYRTWGPRQGLLYLTPRLFAEWQKRGTVFEKREINHGDLKKRVEYGFGVSALKQIDFMVVRRQAEIGGKRQFVIEVGHNDDEVYYPLDAGATFNVPNAKKGVTSQPRRLEGVMPLLEEGWIPMAPGVVHSEYLLGTVEGFPYLWQGGGGVKASYIRSEIVHRKLSDELLEVLVKRERERDTNVGLSDSEVEEIAREKAIAFWKLGITNEQDWYRGRQIEFGPAVISHPHADHNAMFGYYAPMEVVTRAETVGFMRATSNWGTWRQNLIAVSDIRNFKKGRPYQKEYRKFTPIYYDNQRVRLSQHLSVQMPRTNHSIPSAMTGYFKDDQPLIVDTHDFKPGPLTENAVSLFEGMFPIIVTETTNTMDWTKPSTGITEEVVADTIQYLNGKFGQGNMMVVVCPPNNLERVNTIRKVMEQGGKRKVALGAKHAEVIEQLRAESMLAPLGYDDYNLNLPKIGEEVALFAGAKDPETYEKVLRAKAAGGKLGIVDNERLGEDGQEWVVILSPYDVLEKEFEGVSFSKQGFLALHSAYYAYEPQTAWAYAANMNWVNKRDREMRHDGQRARYVVDFELRGDGGFVGPGANYSRDDGKPYGLHASGHGAFGDVFKVIVGLLGGNYRNKELILVHGEHPYKYRNDLEDKFVQEYGKQILDTLRLDRPSGLKITAKLDRYDPHDPIKHPGYRRRVD